MEDIKSILSSHHPKGDLPEKSDENKIIEAKEVPYSHIPDLFFDQILVEYKLSRIEILVLIYLYRFTWCRPNLHKKYGIAPIISHLEFAKTLNISHDELYHSLRKLEGLDFIETIRAGQYFVRKYFTKENDKKYSQNYDNFL